MKIIFIYIFHGCFYLNCVFLNKYSTQNFDYVYNWNLKYTVLYLTIITNCCYAKNPKLQNQIITCEECLFIKRYIYIMSIYKIFLLVKLQVMSFTGYSSLFGLVLYSKRRVWDNNTSNFHNKFPFKFWYFLFQNHIITLMYICAYYYTYIHSVFL